MCHRPLYFLGLLLSWGVCGTHRRRAGSSAGWYYQMCGGSDSVKSFTSQADMVKAGWVFSWDDSSLWDASGTYPSAYRGSSSSGDGAVSIQLAGSGVVAVTYGSDSTGTVSVKMNDQVKGTASANTVSQTVELSFNTGDVLAIQESSSIILLQSIDFICDVTSANVPVWAYPETVSATLPYDMGVQSSLNLNSNSYTLMMWLKQGASEPDDSIIIGQHIDTSTTTTSTSITVTATTVTVSTSTTTQSTTTQLCSWDEIPGVYSPGFASGLEEVFDLYGAKEKCKSLGSSSCKAVTCRGEGVTCTVRSSADLFGSAYGENSYVPSSLCYLGGYRNTVTNINSGVGCTDTATGTGFIMFSGQDIRSRFSAANWAEGNADQFVCVKYDGGWQYDSNDGFVAFSPEDSDVLVASVDFDADSVTSLAGMEEYDNYVTKARLKTAEGIAAALVCSLMSTTLMAANRHLKSLDWPYFFITGSAALLVALGLIAHQRWHGLAIPQSCDMRWVLLRGLSGSANGFFAICAVLAGAYVGSVAALKSVNSIVAALGTVAMGEEFGWMHLLSVTLFVTGAILTADPEEVVASTGSTLFGSGLALSSGICSGGSALFGRKLKEVNPSIVSTSTLLHMWIFSWMLHFIEGVPSGSFQSMESARPQSVALLLSLPVLLLGDTTCGAIASQKCPPAVNTTVTTATNMLAGFCLDYFLRGHAKLVTILGALLIFAAVLTMLRAQLGSHAKAAAAPKGDYAKETSNLLPLEHIANNP
ncbi:unnamed protein product [Effrenium voratum]|nr:unnamed protein product [Effrenium voratum]